MHKILGDCERFISRTSRGLSLIGIDRSELAMMDHLCYRVETDGRYEEMFQRLTEIASHLGSASINGRTIATFELHDYLEVDGWIVPCIELPAPKEESPYPEGLEHAEFVIIGGLERFAEKHAQLPFNRKGMLKDLNPELGLKVNGLSVKFHEQPLGAVVRIEQRLGRGV